MFTTERTLSQSYRCLIVFARWTKLKFYCKISFKVAFLKTNGGGLFEVWELVRVCGAQDSSGRVGEMNKGWAILVDWWFFHFKLTFINLDRRKPPLYLPCSSLHLFFTKFQASSLPFSDPVTPPMANIVSWDRTSSCKKNIQIEYYTTIFMSKRWKLWFVVAYFRTVTNILLIFRDLLGGGGWCWFMVRNFQTEYIFTKGRNVTYTDGEVQHLLNEFFVFDGTERSHDAHFLFL